MGAATALYSATCFTGGKYENGNPYPVALSAVVGLSGWLPCAKYEFLCPYLTAPVYSFAINILSVIISFILLSETYLTR